MRHYSNEDIQKGRLLLLNGRTLEGFNFILIN